MRSIYNHVARDLMEGYDWTWRRLRRALDTAHLAVTSTDLYRELYGVAP